MFIHEYCDQKIWNSWDQEMIDSLNEANREVAQAAQADGLLGNGQLTHDLQAWYDGLAGLSQTSEEINSAVVH